MASTFYPFIIDSNSFCGNVDTISDWIIGITSRVRPMWGESTPTYVDIMLTENPDEAVPTFYGHLRAGVNTTSLAEWAREKGGEDFYQLLLRHSQPTPSSS